MRKALIIGINTYWNAPPLLASVADARAMKAVLEQHKDGKRNYDCRTLLDEMEDGTPITRATLRKACRELFDDFKGDVLLYFSGHGALTSTGGFLCTTDATEGDWGVPMQEIVDIASGCLAREIVLILDCCHAGAMAAPTILNSGTGKNPLAVIREGMTVIAASRDSQPAAEAGGHGLFTAAVLDALEGGAADHMGWVTVPSVYAYVRRRFGAWDPTPVYKSHATDVTVIRECEPLIDRLKLRKLVDLFPRPDYRYPLDPEFEPEDEQGNRKAPPNERKVEMALLFKAYRDAGLLKPSAPNEQLFWTARRSGTVELTPRGREYWWLVAHNRI